MSLIKIKNLNKIYNQNTESELHVLKNINLEIEQGSLNAIIGKSGSGKSTLLHIIGCLDNFTDGEYLLDNNNIKKLSNKQLAEIRNKKIGFVLQEFGLILNKTCYDNIAIPLMFNKNIRHSDINKKVKSVISKVELNEKINRKAGELSGGQKQRIAIARALVNDPEIILADEPTGALDSNTSDEIIKLLFELNKQGKTVIIVTHDNELAKKCPNVIEIKDGNI
jgi:putative ABC transport system ATP-binding protein